MIYNTSFPRIDNLLWLAKLARPYPITAGSVLALAKLWNFTPSTQAFLRQFPADTVFLSGNDFLDRCYDLRLLSREERTMPRERLRSPQD